MTQPLIAVLPFCSKDTNEAARLLEWIQTLDGKIETHALLMVCDDAVALEEKKRLNELGKIVFSNSELVTTKAPAPIGTNYAPPAAVMFGRASLHVDRHYKWNWLWLEPDSVPLRSGWLDALAQAYSICPKRFLGSIIRTDQKDVPPIHMAATAVYPNCAGPELQKFCHGKQHFDLAMADHVKDGVVDTNLIYHRWGTPTDVPTFKDIKLPADGPNVGTLDMIPKEAVLMHRNKDGTLIELLRKGIGWGMTRHEHPTLGEVVDTKLGIKRGPGRPPKQVPTESQMP